MTYVKSLELKKKMNVCDEFEANPDYNPKTGKKIKKTGLVYKRLVKKCKEVKDRRPMEYVYKIQRLHKRFIPNFTDTLYDRLSQIDENLTFTERRSTRRELAYGVKQSMPVEILLKEALDRGYVNNVLYHKDVKIIKRCEQYEFKGTCKSFYKEKTDGLFLPDIDQEDLTDELLANMIQQLLLCLAVLQGKYGIVHFNIDENSIAYRKVEIKGSFRYIVRNREFYVPNLGYIFFLDNFDDCYVYNPKYTDQTFYGTRNAKIVIDQTQEALWGDDTGDNSLRIRFKTKYTPIFNNWAKIVGLTLNKTSDNKFCHLDVKPDISVDLTDMCKFPVWENLIDVAGILKTAAEYIRYDESDEPLWYKKAYQIIDYKGHYTDLSDLYDEMLFPDILVANMFPELRFKTEFVDTYKWP
ncbi:serine-threonine protein kinase [Lymphocystis disease virus 3]|uniref:Serine-threonine protein kinase n=1 Tax=Lymphocystis disease virus 3 TaxID=2560566 RepID=A0A1B2RW91_9VIRU|nr:serine-threonine protein kinase [Lymphocystis disease virus Sa]AOC55246.1 serine-threonine protein kinase [Lymphocystis disease virus 3]